jgi:hypothetical protein
MKEPAAFCGRGDKELSSNADFRAVRRKMPSRLEIAGQKCQNVRRIHADARESDNAPGLR